MSAPADRTVDHLRRLYAVRFVFAAAWAVAFGIAGATLDATSVALLLVYPAFDVAAAVYDVRVSRTPALYANIVISSLAVAGFAVAATDDIAAALRVWGVWAVVAGLVQLTVALRRRRLGGQWAMILSGSISVLAGASFFGSAGSATSMVQVAGYAALGGIFFLVSAVRLELRVRRGQIAGVR